MGNTFIHTDKICGSKIISPHCKLFLIDSWALAHTSSTKTQQPRFCGDFDIMQFIWLLSLKNVSLECEEYHIFSVKLKNDRIVKNRLLIHFCIIYGHSYLSIFYVIYSLYDLKFDANVHGLQWIHSAELVERLKVVESFALAPAARLTCWEIIFQQLSRFWPTRNLSLDRFGSTCKQAENWFASPQLEVVMEKMQIFSFTAHSCFNQ